MLIRALCIAFSIYSKIPVPNFKWENREFEYNLIFFPWVGAVIGILIMLLRWAAAMLGIGDIAFVCILTAIPLLVTGGFHVDGFMDCMDAFASHKSRQEKLEILKDPHIGAFAVIMLGAAGLIFIAAASQISYEAIPVFALSFFLSRALSGISVLKFKKAKSDGMLYSFSAPEKKRSGQIVFYVLVIQAAACAALMIILNPLCGCLIAAAALLLFLYYKYKSEKEFGGITGDAAGYFVVISETAMCVAAAVGSFI